ncbi:hypothetical protein RhiirC2_718835 [Rhizophagus irregularis]|uniref:Uncharacterized protein n=1 Tax=Rhizophagus irregularis TaxID=588596 RepID=A0A2N1MGS0_9GLOM|nr:hypothetical protein RhiirC2_718835 [Rhizophagus irregularis]
MPEEIINTHDLPATTIQPIPSDDRNTWHDKLGILIPNDLLPYVTEDPIYVSKRQEKLKGKHHAPVCILGDFWVLGMQTLGRIINKRFGYCTRQVEIVYKIIPFPEVIFYIIKKIILDFCHNQPYDLCDLSFWYIILTANNSKGIILQQNFFKKDDNRSSDHS